MTDEEIEERLRKEAIRLAKPFLNREVPSRATSTYSDQGFEVLWEEGYVPASKLLLAEGFSAPQVETQMAKIKTLFGIVEPRDLIPFPAELHYKLVADLKAEIATEPPLDQATARRAISQRDLRVHGGDVVEREPACWSASCEGPSQRWRSQREPRQGARKLDSQRRAYRRGFRPQGD